MQFLHNAKLTGYSLVSGRTLVLIMATMDQFALAEDLSLWKDCLEIARQLLARSMDFCFIVRIGSSFSFSLDAQKARKHLQSDGTLGSKVKHKSPSTRKRDRKRQEQFFAKKKAAAVSPSTSPEPASGGHSLEVPRGGSPNQRTPEETSRGSLEIDLTTTSTSKADREGQRLAQKEEITQSTKEALDKIELIQQEGRALVQRLKTMKEKHSK